MDVPHKSGENPEEMAGKKQSLDLNELMNDIRSSQNSMKNAEGSSISKFEEMN